MRNKLARAMSRFVYWMFDDLRNGKDREAEKASLSLVQDRNLCFVYRCNVRYTVPAFIQDLREEFRRERLQIEFREWKQNLYALDQIRAGA